MTSTNPPFSPNMDWKNIVTRSSIWMVVNCIPRDMIEDLSLDLLVTNTLPETLSISDTIPWWVWKNPQYGY